TLGGTLTVTASGGIATFSGLSLNNAGNGYTLQVSSPPGPPILTPFTTGAFNIGPTQLVVTTQPPASVSAGAGFGVVVKAEDASGNVAPSFTGTATIALASNPGGATLGGQLTVPVTNGVATFSNLTLSVAASGYTLTITSNGVLAATTSPI